MTYEDYVGLVLNRHRVQMQRAVAVLAALNAANDAPLGYSWADAIAEDGSEAEEILDEANRQRAESRARKGSRRGF